MVIEKITNFLKEVRLEGKRVNWPTKQETIRYTLIVVGASFIGAIFLGGIDFLFARFLERVVSF
ncbi:MAG: preprotein translocase subunit SecE [bacterium]